MRFNSQEFLFVFLPLVLGGWWLLSRFTARLRLAESWLAAASIAFYAWWDWRFAPLLLLSLGINLGLGKAMVARPGVRRRLLLLGLFWNLGLLGFFKYWNFISWNLSALGAGDLSLPGLILPLGISFFTFQKIAFLVDVDRGRVTHIDALDFTLFVLFFPQLIAGPIVHHADFIPQLRANRPPASEERHQQLRTGALLFIAGLFQKCVIADTLAPLADSAFAMAAQGRHLRFLDAWVGVCAYCLQLYHDFSGYSHMALGLALLFGLRLPLNFLRPYEARSMSEFWRRWHMSLSAFLRDYLYVPLGGNRERHLLNLFLTMLVAGLWHGAGWTFIAWGAWHGAALVVNHLWSKSRSKPLSTQSGVETSASLWSGLLARTLTLFTIALGWVLFRAPDLTCAWDMVRSLSGYHGFSAPVAWTDWVAPLSPAVRARGWLPGIDADPCAFVLLILVLIWTLSSSLPDVHALAGTREADLVALPSWSRKELIQRTEVPDAWKPVLAASMLALALAALGRASAFLYFQF